MSSLATIPTALVTLILCIVGPVLLSMSVRNELRARALADHGAIMNADVTRVTIDRDTDAGERVAYSFVIDGATYDGANRHLGHGDLVLARTLGRIEVRYLPEDPSVSAPTRALTERTQLVAFFLSGTLTMAGLALLGSLAMHRRKAGRWWR